jgi:hypothetical protein
MVGQGSSIGRLAAATGMTLQTADRVVVTDPGDAVAQSLAEQLADSRRALLSALGEADEIVAIRPIGNQGDQLIGEGTRRLLSGLPVREIDFEQLGDRTGALVLLPGGGAWCRPYHEVLPRILRVAERKFGRVVILPSSFDVGCDEVRDALGRSRAHVFARGRTSFEQIQSLCAAELAHDMAFWFDFEPHRRVGSGTLQAFRSDSEASPRSTIPPGNVDLSAECSSFGEWLSRIAAADLVRTDRAHVMIAAALLGKRVEYRTGSYHKLAEIAEYSLRGYPVVRIEHDLPAIPLPPPPPLDLSRRFVVEHSPARVTEPAAEPRVTVALLTRDRLQPVCASLRALRSVQVPHRIVVMDQNSAAEIQDALGRVTAEVGGKFVACDSHDGAVRGRNLLKDQVTTELLFLLDEDAVLYPGTLESLLDVMARQRSAVAVSAKVVDVEGRIDFCGGDDEVRDGVHEFHRRALGEPFEVELGSAPSSWLEHTALLVRRDLLAEIPFDPRCGVYADQEWSLRVRAAYPQGLWCCSDAVALWRGSRPSGQGSGLVGLADTLLALEAAAQFYAVSGEVLDAVFTLVPQWVQDGERDVRSARLLLELLLLRGSDWLLTAWSSGDLEPLFGRLSRERESAEELARERSRSADLATTLAARNAQIEEIGKLKMWRLFDGYWQMRRSVGRWFGRE